MGCLFCEDCKNKAMQPTPDSDQLCFTSSRQISRPISIINFPLYPKIQDSFLFDSSIGEGSFGSSMKIIDKQTRAEKRVKLIPKESLINFSEANPLIYHYESMCGFSHPNINAITQLYQSEEHILLVSDLMSTNLAELFESKQKEMTKKEIQSIMKQVLKGVAYLHNKHINHGNIKIENVLLDTQGNVKLSDYCHSKYFSKKRSIPFYVFSSPESIDSTNICNKCDEWSCGVLLYYLVCGSFPFIAENIEQLIEKIKQNQVESNAKFENLQDFECKDLISKLMTFNTKFRINALDALKHPYLNEIAINPEEKQEQEQEQATMPNEEDIDNSNEEFSLFNKENSYKEIDKEEQKKQLIDCRKRIEKYLGPSNYNTPSSPKNIDMQNVLPVYYTMLLICEDDNQIKNYLNIYYSDNYEAKITQKEANVIITEQQKNCQNHLNLGIIYEDDKASLIVFLNSLIRLKLYFNNSNNAKKLFSKLIQGKENSKISFELIVSEIQALVPSILIQTNKYMNVVNMKLNDNMTEGKFSLIINKISSTQDFKE